MAPPTAERKQLFLEVHRDVRSLSALRSPLWMVRVTMGAFTTLPTTVLWRV